MFARPEAPDAQAPSASPDPRAPISEQLAAWLDGDGDKTVGGLIAVFEEKAFALLFVLLLGISALPIPTGGATHVFDVIAVLVAAQLVAGRDRIWVPKRWQRLPLAGDRQRRFIAAQLKIIRRLERFSKPRMAFLFDRRVTNVAFGLVVIGLTAGAFFAPPFSGLDTLPALGVVVVSLGVLLEDIVIVAFGLTLGIAGVVAEVTLGKAAVKAIGKLF